jgi:hypothetical protein
MTTTFSREYLQQLPAETRKTELQALLHKSTSNAVIALARNGITRYLWSAPFQTDMMKRSLPLAIFTKEELIEGLKEMYPGTRIEYQETWVDARPGVKEQKKGIFIDWS